MTEPEVRAKLIEILSAHYKLPDEEDSSWRWLPPEDVADYILDIKSVEAVVKSKLEQTDDLKTLYGLFHPPLANLNRGVEYLIAKKLTIQIQSELEKATTAKRCYDLAMFCWHPQSYSPELEELRKRIDAKGCELALAELAQASTLLECMDVYECLTCRDETKEEVVAKAQSLTFTFDEAAEAVKQIQSYPDPMKDFLVEAMVDLAGTPEQCKIAFEESSSLDGSDLLSIRKMVKLLREQP
jgi:hypothetical protein